MAKTKKKTAKKATGRTARKKTIAKRKPAAATRGKSTRKAPVKKRAVKKSASRRPANDGVQLGVSLELDARLRELATQMNKTLEEVLIQALTEFADNWEDHLRTVNALNEGDDRVQLSVPPEESAT